jgi:hypothetical protein
MNGREITEAFLALPKDRLIHNFKKVTYSKSLILKGFNISDISLIDELSEVNYLRKKEQIVEDMSYNLKEDLYNLVKKD